MPIVYPEPLTKAQLRRSANLHMIAIGTPLDPSQASLYYVRGRQEDDGPPTLEIVDPAGVFAPTTC